MHDALHITLILLASAVVVVVVFRSLHLPAVLDYLIVGMIVGPTALGLVQASEDQRYLAEFGVVFLMFSVGLDVEDATGELEELLGVGHRVGL